MGACSFKGLFQYLSVGRVPAEGGCSSEKFVVEERGGGDTDGGCGRLMREGEALRRATVSASWRAGTRGLSSRPNPGEVLKQPLSPGRYLSLPDEQDAKARCGGQEGDGFPWGGSHGDHRIRLARHELPEK